MTTDVRRRERRIRRSLSVLSENRLIAFLRAIRKHSDVLAVELINDELDQGRCINTIFLNGERDGYVLAVSRTSGSRFEIEFGCLAGNDAGDGGAWIVEFEGETVRTVEGTASWMS